MHITGGNTVIITAIIRSRKKCESLRAYMVSFLRPSWVLVSIASRNSSKTVDTKDKKKNRGEKNSTIRVGSGPLREDDILSMLPL